MADIETEPLIGWRCYQISIPGLLVSNDSVIMPRERATSWCKKPKCALYPQMFCTCGFHAFKTLEHLVDDRLYMYWGVVAEVAMWGTVHKYSEGMRSQYIYPLRMFTVTEIAEQCQTRLMQYGVPVSKFSTAFPTLWEKYIARRVELDWVAPLTAKQLTDAMWQSGDVEAAKKLQRRLSSAISGRRKSIIRVDKERKRLEAELAQKIEEREAVNRWMASWRKQ